MKPARSLLILLPLAIAGCSSQNKTAAAPQALPATPTAPAPASVSTPPTPTPPKLTVEAHGTYVKTVDAAGNRYESSTGGVKPSDLGVPFYPGSVEMAGGSVIESDPKAQTMVSHRKTNDSPAKVAEFYRKLLRDARVANTSVDVVTQVTVSGKLKNGADFTLVANRRGNDVTTVSISVTRSHS